MLQFSIQKLCSECLAGLRW